MISRTKVACHVQRIWSSDLVSIPFSPRPLGSDWTWATPTIFQWNLHPQVAHRSHNIPIKPHFSCLYSMIFQYIPYIPYIPYISCLRLDSHTSGNIHKSYLPLPCKSMAPPSISSGVASTTAATLVFAVALPRTSPQWRQRPRRRQQQ